MVDGMVLARRATGVVFHVSQVPSWVTDLAKSDRPQSQLVDSLQLVPEFNIWATSRLDPLCAMLRLRPCKDSTKAMLPRC